MAGGTIHCYLDIASLYSYLAYLDLLKNRPLLASHGVEVKFHPVFLGGINHKSGNKPPWTLPAKARYGTFDANRSIARFPGLSLQFPSDLMKVGMTVLPLRTLHYVQSHHSPEVFEATLLYLFQKFWTPPNVDLTSPQNLAQALSEVPGPEGKGKQFAEEEVKKIMAATGTKEVKDRLTNTTQEALDRGAFGAPWLWVVDENGKGEPFFGSDRFRYVYKFLGLPYREVELLPKGSKL
ncbi:glutathione S-transferase kappa 1 [Podospora australis]|uniref:Glutathione S-transferase kappa n=1 Tax=Podospora australis TaxID=1536484 RepID=A0AAN7ALX6_9PEZI|nr:glutathione S-transferase kappa 1 [Podospora australis]